jgi:triacylglycerol lipase
VQDASIASKIAAIGPAVTPQMVAATMDLFAPFHTRTDVTSASVRRDLRYGPHERHRLDVFAPAGPIETPKPVLMFVHGGGFIAGDKCAPGRPFYDNVALWAMRNGLIGVTMTYRLAPEHTWPAGSDDVAAAVRWIRQNIGAYGGDAERIVVMGQSAGAVHVAGFLAREQNGQPAGAILVSGLYDVMTMERNPLFHAYFGNDATAHREATFVRELASTKVPLMMVVAEHDPADFQRQAAQLLNAYCESHARLPRLLQASGDNHLSTVLQINSERDRLGDPLLRFIHALRDVHGNSSAGL